MKLINNTNWDTLDIKKILIKTLNEFEKIEKGIPQREYLEVEIVYTKSNAGIANIAAKCNKCGRKFANSFTRTKHSEGWRAFWERTHKEICPRAEVVLERIITRPYLNGYAYVGGRYVRLRVPKKDYENFERDLAWVFWHELYHIKGIKSHRRIPHEDILKEKVDPFVGQFDIKEKVCELVEEV